MKLSVAIVNWNTRDLTDQCLASVYQTLHDLEAEVLVVDNNSKDGTADMVRSKYPQVKLIQMEENIGFAAANNVAHEKSCGEFFLLLNSDTTVHPGAFQALVRFMEEHPDAGAAGCRLLNGDGTLQRSCSPFPRPLTEFFDALYLSKIFPRSRLFGAYAMSYCSFDQPMEVDFAGGSCLILRRQALEQVGLLDEGYFMYSEEADLCFRLKQAGWKIYFTPDGVVTHLGGQSSKLDVKRNSVELYRSKYRFMQKHYGPVSAASYRMLVAVSAALRAAAWSLRSIKGLHGEIFKQKARIQSGIFKWAILGGRQ